MCMLNGKWQSFLGHFQVPILFYCKHLNIMTFFHTIYWTNLFETLNHRKTSASHKLACYFLKNITIKIVAFTLNYTFIFIFRARKIEKNAKRSLSSSTISSREKNYQNSGTLFFYCAIFRAC